MADSLLPGRFAGVVLRKGAANYSEKEGCFLPLEVLKVRSLRGAGVLRNTA